MTIVAPLALLWAGAIALAFADGRRPAVVRTAGAVLVAALMLCARLAWRVREGPVETTTGGWPVGVGITLYADALGTAFALLSLGMLAAALFGRAARGPAAPRFPALVLFMGTGLTGLCLTGDAFNFYVFFEISIVSAFALNAQARRRREVRAALLFVTMNMFGSLVFLAAVAVLYRQAGTLELRAMAAALEAASAPATAAGALLLAAFALKLGLFPFHVWLPEVYRDLRPEVSAIFAGVLANIGSYGVLRFGGTVLSRELDAFAPVVLTLGTASVLYGGLAAVGARQPAGVLAYSAIGQVGYVLAAATLGPPGLAAAFVYAVVNAVQKTLLFLTAGRRSLVASMAFAAGALSLAGVPPFAGFVAKAAIFRSAVEGGAWLTLAVLVAGSALTFLYIFPVARRHAAGPVAGGESPLAATAMAALAMGLAAAGAWPGPLIGLAEVAAAPLGAPP